MIQIVDKRKTTIIEEIDYWKEHKLLPDVYCDYLMALYTNGEGKPERKAGIGWRNLAKWMQLSMLFLLIPFSFIMLYYTEFHIILTTGCLLLFAFFAAFFMNKVADSRSAVYHIAIISKILLVLLLCLHLSSFFNAGQGIQVLLIILNLGYWFMLAKKLALEYLRITSCLSALIVILYTIL